ncbi:MAG: hypothetical protein Q7R76_05600 [Candidatus Woesearchaeota archaeon]|nr:hypothetical protein [Candidatus Woesearchaeota archaeon]
MVKKSLLDRVHDATPLSVPLLVCATFIGGGLYLGRYLDKLDDVRWCRQKTYSSSVSGNTFDPVTVAGPLTNLSCNELFNWDTPSPVVRFLNNYAAAKYGIR